MPKHGSASGARRSGVRNAAVLIDSYSKGSALRRAKISGGVAAGVSAVLAFIVSSLASTVPGEAVELSGPVTTMFISAIVAGLVVFVVVVAWPVVRVLWHWAAELILTVLLLAIYVPLAMSVSGLVAITAVVMVFGVPWMVPSSRRFLWPWVMCMVMRHRMRVACDAFIEGKGVHGSVMPLILWAKPSGAGERIWLWLRGDLTVGDLEDRVKAIASTCWAREATVEKAGSRAAYVVVDLYRTDPLAQPVEATVIDHLPAEYRLDAGDGEMVDMQGSTLDEAAEDEARERLAEALNSKPKKNGKPEKAKNEKSNVVLDADGDDISEWI